MSKSCLIIQAFRALKFFKQNIHIYIPKSKEGEKLLLLACFEKRN